MTAPLNDYSLPSYDLASAWKRLGAWIIDSLIILVFVRAGMAAIDLFFLWQHPAWYSRQLYAYCFGAVILVAAAYFLFCDALPRGQSIGKRVMKIAVVSFPFETRCTLLQSFLRNLPKYFLSLFDAVFIFFGYRRRLGDMLGSTIVVNRAPKSAPATAEPQA